MMSSTSTSMAIAMPLMQTLVIDDEQYEYGGVKSHAIDADSWDH